MATTPDPLDVLKRCVHFLADLNGSNWITDQGAGGLDMRQRARNLQHIAFESIAKADPNYYGRT